VRTVSTGEGRPASPGFGSGSPVSFQAAQLTAEQIPRRATYKGAARAWQEGMSVQAEEIVVDESARQLRASGNVMSRLTQRPAPTAAAGSRPTTTTITARRLVVDESTGTAHYQEDARLARPDASLAAGSLIVHTKEIARRRELERIEASGSVSAKHAGSLATSETAEFLPGRQLLILRDAAGLAEVVDAATGHAMRGRELTYDLSGERILTETSEGARTWITLTPDGKEGPRLEPQTRH
jgi:lipopolysaccharide export system protein LptA